MLLSADSSGIHTLANTVKNPSHVILGCGGGDDDGGGRSSEDSTTWIGNVDDEVSTGGWSSSGCDDPPATAPLSLYVSCEVERLYSLKYIVTPNAMTAAIINNRNGCRRCVIRNHLEDNDVDDDAAVEDFVILAMLNFPAV